MSIERIKEIRRRRKRRAKLLMLRKRLIKASGAGRQTILQKIRKISPFYPVDRLNEQSGG